MAQAPVSLSYLQRRFDMAVQASFDNPKDVQLCISQARAGVDLVICYCQNQSDARKGEVVYSQLAKLSEKFPKEPALRLFQAQAADELVQAMVSFATFSAIKIYREIAAHGANYPREKELINIQAALLYNLVAGLCDQELHLAKEFYQNSARLAQLNMDQPGVRRAWIWAGSALLVSFLKRGENDSFNALLLPLEETMVDAFLSMRVRVFHLMDNEKKVRELLSEIEINNGADAVEIVIWYAGI